MNQLESVRTWLKKSCIVVPHDWIEACLEWIQEQNQGLSLRNDELNNMVYEQWLMTDLRELSASCLPQQIEDAPKVQLSGSYVLQVNSCVDVGIPYYGQLQKVRGTENANCKVSGEQTFQPAWQPKPSRLLMLKVTDGTLNVQGVEYQHIPQLNDIVPGTKILVQGNVLCRRGVLLLKSENVQILGGEVDSLMEENTKEHVLESAMQDSSTHANKSEKKQFSGHILSEGNIKPFVKKEISSQSQQTSFVQHVKNEIRNPPRSVTDNNQPRNLLSRPQIKNEIKKESNCSFPMTGGNAVQFSGSNARDRGQPKEEEYEWCDDMDDTFLDDMDDFNIDNQPDVIESQKGYNISKSAHYDDNFYTSTEGTAHMGRKGYTCLPRQPYERTSSEQTSTSIHSSSANTQSTADHSRSKVNNQFEDCTIISSQESVSDFEDDFDMEDLEAVKILESCTESRAEMNNKTLPGLGSAKRNTLCDSTSVDTYSESEPLSTNIEHFTGPSLPKIKTLSDSSFENYKKMPVLIKAESHLDLSSNLPKQDALLTSCSQDNVSVSSFSTKIASCQKQARYSEISASKQRINKSNTSSKLNSASQNRTCIPKAVIRPLQKNETKATSNVSSQSTIERFLGIASPHSSLTREIPSSSVDTEFTYLSEAMKQPVEGKVFLIKGYIATLTSKLTGRQGRDWHLSCKVNDGSAVADMDLSDEVLTELIGFSAPDSLVMRQRAKSDPSVKDILTKGLQQCQQRLVDLSCLMEIQIGPGTSHLSVQRFIPIESKHILVLHNRVLSSASFQ